MTIANRRAALRGLHSTLVRLAASLGHVVEGEVEELGRPGAEHRLTDPGKQDAEAETAEALLAVEEVELAQVQRALAAYAQGRYGVCEECRVEIPLARLRARPVATRCTDCQRQAERAGST